MPEEGPDVKFWELADSFIDLANEHCDAVSRGKVSAAFLYAAARFNSFVVNAAAASIEDFKSEKEAAQEYFISQYKKMLAENLNDYELNFEKYTK